MKYAVGSVYYMKRKYGAFSKGECVTIIERKKRGKRTYVSVKNIQGEKLNYISVKLLRKHKRS